MTSQKVAAQTASEFAAFCADFFEHFCPEQQVNRDFAIVLVERAHRTQVFDVVTAAFDWLTETAVDA